MSDLEDIDINQSERVISVESFHLGNKKILVIAFEGTEELSALSRFRLEIVTHGRALHPSEILGKSLTIALRFRGLVKKFNGIISRFQTLQSTVRDHYLQIAEMVPPAWLLTLNQRCRVFHEKKATDVVSQVLQEGSVNASVKSSGESKEYIVEYNESDFNFISRLLEDEGLFYYFKHWETNCPMVIGSGASDYVRGGTIPLDFNDGISNWHPQYRVGPTAFQHGAWDFKAVKVMPGSANALAKAQTSTPGDRSFFEYPGRHGTAGEGTNYARLRMEEHESEYVRISGTSPFVSMHAGATFSIRDHKTDLPQAKATTDRYVVVMVDHRARDGSGTAFENPASYENTFECIPAEFNFRPARTTRRPFIRGPQTAVVTDGPDPFGRSKVKFPWDEKEESCWCRIAQNWAYNQMGTQFLPRINSEVVVEFLDGDPDYPLIVGMVHNGKNKLLYETPANKTQSGIRGANWGDPGADKKSNELRFEDKAGSEEIYFHAQKDFLRVVKNDDTLTVEEGNRKIDIKQGNLDQTLDQGNETNTLKQGNQSTKISLGDHSLKIDAGQSTVEAMQSITLKVGSSSIVIDQKGVTIKGMMISIEGTAKLDAKSPMTTVNGDGMLTLKGGVTMIN